MVPLPEKRHGGLLVAWSKEEALRLPAIHERAALNGVKTQLLAPKEVRIGITLAMSLPRIAPSCRTHLCVLL